MDSLRCEICGLAFGDPGAMARHRKVCNAETIGLMKQDVGKLFMAADGDKRVFGKIVNVADCFGYEVNAISVEEKDDGTLALSLAKGPESLRSDEKWAELTPDEMRFQLGRIQGMVVEGMMEVWS